MTSDEAAAGRTAWLTDGTRPRRRTLTEFLQEEGLTVLDVVHGASVGTRRLLVGFRGGRHVRYAVSVPRWPAFDEVAVNEAVVLDHLARALDTGGAALAGTLPRTVEALSGPSSETALAVTAVSSVGRPVGDATPAAVLASVAHWLAGIWQHTATGTMCSLLGQGQLDALLGRVRDTSRAEDDVLPLLRARQRVTAVPVPSTTAHGCLCRRHVHHDGSEVTGVDDWGVGSPASDPLRDLGRYFVDVAGDDLPAVVGNRSELSPAVRGAVGLGLEALGAPTSLWREVLLLAQLEAAGAGSARGDRSGVALLKRTVEALPRPTSTEGKKA